MRVLLSQRIQTNSKFDKCRIADVFRDACGDPLLDLDGVNILLMAAHQIVDNLSVQDNGVKVRARYFNCDVLVDWSSDVCSSDLEMSAGRTDS